MRRNTTGSRPVESVRRVFALLAELNCRRISSVQQLHEATSLPKSTIVRLLNTLCTLGYATNDPRQGGYLVASQVRSLSAGFCGDPMVVEAARPWSIEFTRRYHLPVTVAVFDQNNMAVRFSTSKDTPMSPHHTSHNMRLPILTRAVGRAYLAYCPARERNRIIKTLRSSPHPEDQIANEPDEVDKMINGVLRRGFAERAVSAEPRSSNSFSVPIIQQQNVMATIGVSYYRSAVPSAKARSEYVPLLFDLAENIKKSLGDLNG